MICVDAKKEVKCFVLLDKFHDDDRSDTSSGELDFDPEIHNPVFFGQWHHPVSGDFEPAQELDPQISHPSCVGYWMSSEKLAQLGKRRRALPDVKTCSNREYLDHYVWPSVLPALENTLIRAKRAGCFGWKRVSFSCFEFLTEYLYNHNPMHPFRTHTPYEEIPYVKKWLELHPREPPPTALTWTEDETALKIQSAWRGYLVRKHSEVQELRIWQKEWRIVNRGGIVRSM